MYQQIALQLAQRTDPMMAEQLANNIMTCAAASQGASMPPVGGKNPLKQDGGAGGNVTKMNNARERAQNSSQPRV
jgi:hypothetical protein